MNTDEKYTRLVDSEDEKQFIHNQIEDAGKRPLEIAEYFREELSKRKHTKEKES